MKLLALQGSERTAGLTAAVLDLAREHLGQRGHELEIVALADLDLRPCGQCGDCNSLPYPCNVDDDVASVVRRMMQADGIIYAAPAHGFGTASKMQTFVERAGVGYLRFDRPLTNKVAGVIVTGRRYNLGAVHDQLVNNVLLNRMILVGSGFPVLFEELSGVRGQTRPEAVKALYSMLDRMVDMGELLAHGAQKGLALQNPASTERV